VPVFGDLINKSVIARWTRTLSTMFAAGVPLVEALDSVGGASGNASTRWPPSRSRRTCPPARPDHLDDGHRRLPGDGAADGGHRRGVRLARPHAGKAAEFYEDEVDEMVKGLSSLMEPFIIVILGVIIGGIVVSMYLPIFKLGAVV
jgi:type IV pilus assembly protein PilC